MARPLLPARVRENMAKPPNHPVSRTLAKNQRLAVFVRKIGRQEQHHTFFISKNMWGVSVSSWPAAVANLRPTAIFAGNRLAPGDAADWG